MMKHEFAELVNKEIPSWQWPVIETVYRDDDENIPDVGGKQVIAAIYLQPEGFDKIYNRYRELGNTAEVIKYQVETAFETYDVNYDGYVRNQKAKPLHVVMNWLRNEFKAKYPELDAQLDYFSISRYPDNKKELYPLDTRLAVFYVTGGAEGYYCHVEALTDKSHDCLCLLKTLHEGQEGRTLMVQCVAALSELLMV